MASSKSKPQIEPPPEELDIALAVESTETLEECLDEMELCDHAIDNFPEEEKYGLPLPLLCTVLNLYSTLKGTSTAVVTYMRETIAKGYDFELLKACFKKPESGRDPLQKAPEGGDDSGKIAYAFLQKMKNYVSNELMEIFRWNGYHTKEEKQPPSS